MNRMFMACTRAVVFAALCLGALTAVGTAQGTPQGAATAPRLIVTREGERAIVQFTGDSLTAASLSEPFLLHDRTRVYLVIEASAAQIPAASEDSVAAAGLLAVTPEQYNGNLRIAVELSALGAYGLEQRTTGPALWLEAAPATPPASDEATAAPLSVEPAASAASAPSVIGELSLSPLVRARLVASTYAERLWRAGRVGTTVVGERVRVAAAAIAPLRWHIALGMLLLILPLAMWKVLSVRRAKANPASGSRHDAAATPVNRPDMRTSDVRLWAAKTLAQQGLEPAEIAERTGLSRDAVALLAANLNAAKTAALGKNFRPGAPAPASAVRSTTVVTI